MMWRVAYKLELGMLSYQANYNPYLVNEKNVFSQTNMMFLFLFISQKQML